MASGGASGEKPGYIFKRDYWIVDGVPKYAVTLATAAVVLDVSKGALEDRLDKLRKKGFQSFARKGADGLLRVRIRELNDMMGIGDDLEWLEAEQPPEKPRGTEPKERPNNVVPMRKGEA